MGERRARLAKAGRHAPAPRGQGAASSAPPTAAELDAVFDALAHLARRQILLILHARGGAMTAGEVAARFRHAWPTTTRHLRVLQDARLIVSTRDGRKRLYTFDHARLRAATEWLAAWAFDEQGPVSPIEGWRGFGYASMRNTIPPGAPPPSTDAPPVRTRSRSPRNHHL